MKKTNVAVFVATLKGALDTGLTQKDVFVGTTNQRLNDGFIAKLKADIKENPEKYGPNAQKISNGTILVRQIATTPVELVETSIARYVEKYETHQSQGGWNI
jgi:hypothetical protein